MRCKNVTKVIYRFIINDMVSFPCSFFDTFSVFKQYKWKSTRPLCILIFWYFYFQDLEKIQMVKGDILRKPSMKQPQSIKNNIIMALPAQQWKRSVSIPADIIIKTSLFLLQLTRSWIIFILFAQFLQSWRHAILFTIGYYDWFELMIFAPYVILPLWIS